MLVSVSGSRLAAHSQEAVDRGVEVERKVWRLPEIGFDVQPEAARALQEQLDPGAAKREGHRLVLRGLRPI